MTSATSLERLRVYRQETKENKFGKYYIDVSIQSMSNLQKRGPKLVTMYRATNSQYAIHDYIDDINSRIKSNSTQYYVYTPFFIEWVPKETIEQNIDISVNDYLENFEHVYDLTTRGEYDTTEVPPGANKFRLPADADLSSYILRIWISPHTSITWMGEQGIKKLGFNEKDPNHTKIVYPKSKREGKKMFYMANAHNTEYKTLNAIKSPSQLILGPNNKSVIRVSIDINLEETFELVTLPPRANNIEEVHSALQDTVSSISETINFPLFVSLEDPPSSASPYLLRVIMTNTVNTKLTLSTSLTNAANIYNPTLTSENPVWTTETYPPPDGTDPPPSESDEYVEESILDPDVTLPETHTDREDGGIVDNPEDEGEEEEEEEEETGDGGGGKRQEQDGEEDGVEEEEEEEETEEIDDEEAARIAEEAAKEAAEAERKRLEEEEAAAEAERKRLEEEEAAAKAERKRLEEEEAAAQEEEEAAAEEEENEDGKPSSGGIDPSFVIGPGGSKRKNQDGNDGNEEQKKIKTDPANDSHTSGGGSGSGGGGGGTKGSGGLGPPQYNEPIYVKYPVSGTEKISMIVQQVGYLYVCVDELYDPFFPGKLFFVMKPKNDGWNLMDSYHMQQPYILTKDDMEKLNDNPITLSVYFRTDSVNFELFSQFSNHFEGLFYWRTD